MIRDALSAIQSTVSTVCSPSVTHNHLLNCVQVFASDAYELNRLSGLAMQHLNSLGLDHTVSSFPCGVDNLVMAFIFVGRARDVWSRTVIDFGVESPKKYYAAIAKGDKNKAVYGVGSSHSEALDDADEWCKSSRQWHVHECSFAAYSDIRQNGWHGQTAIENGVVVLSDEYVD